MSQAPGRTLLVFLALVCVNGNIVKWESPDNLHPVQGLYVKPSVDGTTGDLYVAASEDNGSSAQWVADQPVNFLTKPALFSTSYTKSSNPGEGVITTQKQAVFTSQPVKYTYGVPGSSAVTPYAPQQNSPAPYTDYGSAMPYFPYNYFYPYIMSAAAATAAHALKEAGLSEEMANAILSHSSSLWQPPASYQSYSYPQLQYGVPDYNTWLQSQGPKLDVSSTDH